MKHTTLYERLCIMLDRSINSVTVGLHADSSFDLYAIQPSLSTSPVKKFHEIAFSGKHSFGQIVSHFIGGNNCLRMTLFADVENTRLHGITGLCVKLRGCGWKKATLILKKHQNHLLLIKLDTLRRLNRTLENYA